MKISVIVPCRNEKQHIRQFLDSALSQELDAGWEMEIIVADGMSDDGTREELSAYCRNSPNVRLIDNPGRIVSTGLNSAIQASSGEIVLRLDCHTTYAPDYMRQCVRALQETGFDNVGGPMVAEGRGFLGKAIASAFQSRFCAGGGRAHDPNYEGEVDTVHLGCWYRSSFERFGLFDSNLVRNQDDEFNFRLRRMGGRIWQSPRIKSTYVPRASLRRLFQQYLQYGFWKVVVIRKHRALASWRHAIPVLFVTWVLASLFVMLIAGIAHQPALESAVGIFLAAGLSIYAAACVLASLQFVSSLPVHSLLVLPVVIATYHVSYGLGFLLGILKSSNDSGGSKSPGRLFTALTR
jgi:succinoglycan biosynthesis protein ExoA